MEIPRWCDVQRQTCRQVICCSFVTFDLAELMTLGRLKARHFGAAFRLLVRSAACCWIALQATRWANKCFKADNVATHHRALGIAPTVTVFRCSFTNSLISTLRDASDVKERRRTNVALCNDTENSLHPKSQRSAHTLETVLTMSVQALLTKQRISRDSSSIGRCYRVTRPRCALFMIHKASFSHRSLVYPTQQQKSITAMSVYVTISETGARLIRFHTFFCCCLLALWVLFLLPSNQKFPIVKKCLSRPALRESFMFGVWF